MWGPILLWDDRGGLKGLRVMCLILTSILLVYTGVWKIVLSLIVAAVFFILGGTFCLCVGRTAEEGTNDKERRRTQGWVEYVEGVEGELKAPRGKLDMRISGSAIIDEIIHEMIDYIVRDFVHSWYDFVSTDDEFIHKLRAAIQESFVNLSSRVKEVDWTPYLTTQLVDDAASHVRLYRTALAKVKENNNCDLLSVFFDLEASFERQNLCRDLVSVDDSHLSDYFQGIADSVLYLLLPTDIYACNPVSVLAQDLLVQYILIPLLNLFSDPDFVNQYVVWLCQGFPVSSDTFLSVIRTSDSIDEMSEGIEFFAEVQAELKAKCSVNGEDLSLLKSQLKSANIIRKSCENRLSILKNGGEASADWTDDGDGWQNYFLTPGIKLRLLSINEILNNSVSVSYFLDYMNGVGGANYLLMYFNVSAWKSLAEQQFAVIEKQNAHGKSEAENSQAMLDCLKAAASNIYTEFIPENAKHRVRIPDAVHKRLCINLQTFNINSSLMFDEILETILEILEFQEKFYPSFLKSKHYIKCLMDLDLLRTDLTDNASDDDEDDDLSSFEDFGLTTDGDISSSVAEDYQTCIECLKQRKQSQDGLSSSDILLWERGYLERKYRIKAEIIEAGLTTEKGKQFGVFAIQVVRTESWDNKERRWHLYRRYSDFYDFHQWIKSKWMRLNKIDFPSKHSFTLVNRLFLEKRMLALNKYIAEIISLTSEECFGESLKDALLHFLEPGHYLIKKKLLSEKIETFVNPLKQSVKSVTSAVKNAPDLISDTFISTLDGFTKIFLPKTDESEQLTAGLNIGLKSIDEDDDNIPLRIGLIFFDEVFELKHRNQWLRRRIIAFFREILKAMYGDTINRRIIDHVAFMTNPVRVSGYLRNLQQTLWPNGQKPERQNFRDTGTKMRTRLAAKASLFASISDELKRLIGSETTRRGLLSVFDMLQNRVLNRRFTLVLFEGILKTLFPDKPISEIVQRLHYRSNRVAKQRPFLVSNSLKVSNPHPHAGWVSPRGSRKKKS